MLWYLKSKIFIESVINLSVCEADLFIDGQLQKRPGGHKLGAVYQILDENTPRMFSSLKRMLLDYLQPSAVQLVGNLNDCLRRCFDRSRSTVCRATSSSSMPSLMPTILRSSQSSNDSSDSDSPRLPMRISPSSNVQPAAELALDSVPSARPNSIRPTTSVVCLIEYTASVQRSWHWLKPSIVPHSLAMRSDLASRVLGVASANNCRDYIFCPTAVLPDARSGSVISFPKVLLQLTDSKGQKLDSRELDNFKIDLSAPPSSASKGSVFRNTGYSIRVRQYFLQIEAAVIAAADKCWWYMNDGGRLHFLFFQRIFICISHFTSRAVACCHTRRTSVKKWRISGILFSAMGRAQCSCCIPCLVRGGRSTFCTWSSEMSMYATACSRRVYVAHLAEQTGSCRLIVRLGEDTLTKLKLKLAAT